MKSHNWDTIGVREDHGREASAYLREQDLMDGHCGKYAQRFEIQDLVSPCSPIYQSLQRLCERKRLFVLGWEGVEGIVTIADLLKQPVRLMLFAEVSLLEMALLTMIGQLFPNDGWTAKLSACRVEKARELHSQRILKKQDIDLADCLQLFDKARILLKDEKWDAWGFASKGEADGFFESLNTLRDNLAHGQDPSQGADWTEVSTLFTKTQEITRRIAGGHG